MIVIVALRPRVLPRWSAKPHNRSFFSARLVVVFPRDGAKELSLQNAIAVRRKKGCEMSTSIQDFDKLQML